MIDFVPRPGVTVMTDVYCDLSDTESESLRAPDVVLVGDLSTPKDEVYAGTPILAVEIRGRQSKHYLKEKVKLYLEHDWPCTWIAHVERQELEVVRPAVGSVIYQLNAVVPLVPELDKHGLSALPVKAVFDEREAARFNDEWVAARTQHRRCWTSCAPAESKCKKQYRRASSPRAISRPCSGGWCSPQQHLRGRHSPEE